MSNGERLPWRDAAVLAKEIVALLRPTCEPERLKLAGSLRRQEATVGDIEIVCQAVTYLETDAPDLFGTATVTREVSLLERTCARLLAEGLFVPRLNKAGRATIGPKLKEVLYLSPSGASIGVDITITDAASWGAWLAIRTGPAEFSHGLVTHRSQGGLLPEWLVIKDGFHFHHFRTGERFETPEEADVFELLGLAFIEPKDRCWPLPRHLLMPLAPAADQPEPEPTDREGRWRRFDAENPHVYEILVRLTAEAVAKGHQRLGIRTLWERMRWEIAMTTEGDPNWKLNNDHAPFFARKLLAEHPEWNGLFELRERHGERSVA